MDLKTNHASPVLTENSPVNISRLPFRQNWLPCPSPTATAVFPAGLHLTVPKKRTGILEDVFYTGWLDAMKASSPPPKRVSRNEHEKDRAADTDLAYQTWMVPSFLRLSFSYCCILELVTFWKLLKVYSCQNCRLSTHLDCPHLRK